MRLRHALLLILMTGLTAVNAQEFRSGQVFRVVEKSDTLMCLVLPEVEVRTSRDAYLQKYEYTKKMVLKNIALANYIRDFSNELDKNVSEMDRRREKKKYLKSEKEKLFDAFSEIAKDMSLNEGRYFNKLVYRQSGKTTYEIIQQFQGSAKAMLWQGLSRSGGANLKMKYDPYYTDKIIEDVMQKIESGKIKIPKLPRTVEEYNKPVYQ